MSQLLKNFNLRNKKFLLPSDHKSHIAATFRLHMDKIEYPLLLNDDRFLLGRDWRTYHSQSLRNP